MDIEVLRELVSQKVAAEIIMDAVFTIEKQGLQHYVFKCHGGTHRSVACAVLLITLVYTSATLTLTTKRTRDDAKNKWECTEVHD